MIVLLEIVAVALNIFFVWPQTIRVLRTKSLAGISAISWTLSVILFVVWGTYAIQEHYWSLLIANASCLVGATILLVAGVRFGWPKRTLAAAAAGVTAAIVLSLLSSIVLVAIMTVSGAALRLPQIVKLLRSQDVTGVSATTWLLSTATAATWLVISTSRHATGAMIANIAALVMGLVLLALLWWRRTKTNNHEVNR